MDDLSTIFFDILVVIAILISVLLAFYRGLFKELLSMILWIGSLTLGLLGSLELTPGLSSHVPSVPGLNWIIGGVINFISFLCFTSLFSNDRGFERYSIISTGKNF